MSENSLLNAAVFVNGARTVRNVNVAWDDEKVQVQSRAGNRRVVAEYPILETASTGDKAMAWDSTDDRGDRIRLVAQVGCGCSGQMKDYEFDADYSMALTRK